MRSADRLLRPERRSGPRLLAVALLLAVCVGCSGGSHGSAGTVSGSTSTGSSTSPPTATVTTSSSSRPPSTSTPVSCPARILGQLSDAELVGQVFVVGISTGSPSATASGATLAAEVRAGGYILYGGSNAGVASIAALNRRVSGQLVGRTGGIRPFVAADQEGGQVQALTGPGFSAIPSALEQGTWSPERVQAAAQQWGRELRAAGVNLDFAPVLDVVPVALGAANQPIGRYQREFGSSPDAVAEHGVAFLRGLQAAGLAATAKHFPGLGRVIGNTDVTSGVTDQQTRPGDPFLAPFGAAAGAGVQFVMLSTAEYQLIDPGRPAAFSARVVALLRQSLHFGGLIISDDLGAAEQVANVPVGQRPLEFLRAGGQLVLAVKPPAAIPAMVQAVLAQVRADPAFRATVRAAALAVLEQKQRAGLLPC